MKKHLTLLIVMMTILMTSACGKAPAPTLTLTSVENVTIELNEQTPVTALFFFSMSNPVALGAFDRLPDKIHKNAETVGIAMHVGQIMYGNIGTTGSTTNNPLSQSRFAIQKKTAMVINSQSTTASFSSKDP